MIRITEIKEVLGCICDVMIREKEVLTEIDSRLGDGDMGISMEKGAAAVRQVLESGCDNSISGLLQAAAMAFNRAAPSTLGTLISFSMMSVARETQGSNEITEEQAVCFPGIMADTISAKGKANRGDKTILDALIPFADTLRSVYDEKKDIGEALEAACAAAEKGMESTKGMLAKTGRASWLDGRNKEFPDGGAVLCVKIVQELCARGKEDSTGNGT